MAVAAAFIAIPISTSECLRSKTVANFNPVPLQSGNAQFDRLNEHSCYAFAATRRRYRRPGGGIGEKE